MENLNIIVKQFGFEIERHYAPGWKRTPDGYCVNHNTGTCNVQLGWYPNLKEAAEYIATVIANNEHWGVK